MHLFWCVCHSLSESDTNSPNFIASMILNASNDNKTYHDVGIGSFHELLLQQAFASVMLDAYTDWSNLSCSRKDEGSHTETSRKL